MAHAADQVTAPVLGHGEGALWDTRTSTLHCVDMLAGDLVSFRDDRIARTHVGSILAMVRPTDGDGFVAAVEDRVVLLDAAGGRVSDLTSALVGAPARLNEGACLPDGSLLVGSLSHAEPETGGVLFRVMPDGGTSVVRDRTGISNGVGVSPDGATGYHVDSAARRVAAFDVEDPAGTYRDLIAFGDEPGAPDGLWVDTEGHLWVAVYGGSAVLRFRPDGGLDDRVTVAARQVTSCTFGGPDLQTLYITTSREHLADDDDPLAGSIFALDVGIAGLPAAPFAAHTVPELGREKEHP